MSALKYCEKHDIWYNYNDGCPECTKFARTAGNIIGNVIGITVGGAILAGRAIKKTIKENKAKKVATVVQDCNNSQAKVTPIHLTNVKLEFGAESIIFHVHFNVNDALSQNVICAAYLYDSNCNPIINTDAQIQYKTNEGQVSTSLCAVPPYQNCEYSDFQIQIPYSEVPSSYRNCVLKYLICIFINGNSVYRSNFYDFEYKVVQTLQTGTNAIEQNICATRQIVSFQTKEEADFQCENIKHLLQNGNFVPFEQANYLLDCDPSLDTFKIVASFFNKKGAEGHFVFTGDMESEMEVDYFEMVYRILRAFIIQSKESRAFPSMVLKKIISQSNNNCFINCVLSFTREDFIVRMRRGEEFLQNIFQEINGAAEKRFDMLQ